jgi:hypothetical protein
LTSVEQSLVEHVGRGEWLDLVTDDEVVDEAAMPSWGDSRTCRAIVIRDILRGRLVADADPHGLRLRGARISGRLDLENLVRDVSFELCDCFLEEGILARDSHFTVIALTGCRIEHPAEIPLDGARLSCRVLLLNRASAIGHAITGAVNLSGANISGSLYCDGADLRNDSGPALAADGLQIGQGMFLRHGFTATGSGHTGAVRLSGANIGSTLDCDGASLRNDSGPALAADGLQVGQGMFLRDGFTATGGDRFGAVHLSGANIGGHLDCTGATLNNHSGPALAGDSLQVDQAMFLRGKFTATGSTGAGAVRLSGAHIGSTLDCDGADLRNESGPALLADRLQVGQAIYLTSRFTATGGGEGVTVDLRGAQVGGTLVFTPKQLDHVTDFRRRLAVDGLTYAGVPQASFPHDWLELLRNDTPYYAAQPYQQLAAGYRALGDERRARRTLMAQHDDQLARTYSRSGQRLLGQLYKVTLGYGYQPWRLLAWLGVVVVLSCVLAVALGSHGALAQTEKTATPGGPCTMIQQVSVGLDLNLPFGTSLARGGCDLTKNSSTAATWLTGAGVVLRVLAWAFAALFIVAFTGAIRKT